MCSVYDSKVTLYLINVQLFLRKSVNIAVEIISFYLCSAVHSGDWFDIYTMTWINVRLALCLMLKCSLYDDPFYTL